MYVTTRPKVPKMPFILLQIGQPQLGDGNGVGLERPDNKLALDADSREICARWNVPAQIGIRRFLPRAFWLGLATFHMGSI